MSYNIPRNATAIDDLPDIDEMEGPRQINQSTRNKQSKYPGHGMLPPNEGDKYQKFVRGSYMPPPESGMVQAPQQPMYPQNFQGVPIQETYEDIKKINMPDNSPSCIDVCNHIRACPICTRFYDNDKTAYIIAIVVLAIVCILLLKRVLDV